MSAGNGQEENLLTSLFGYINLPQALIRYFDRRGLLFPAGHSALSRPAGGTLRSRRSAGDTSHVFPDAQTRTYFFLLQIQML
jgi:hypothetical protein